MEELDKLNLCFEDPKSAQFVAQQVYEAMEEFKHLITSGAIPNKEDPLYASLGESTTPGIQYVPALLIKANENYCFYGNGIQLIDASYEYTRLMSVMEEHKNQKSQRRIGGKGKQALPQLPKFHLPTKTTAQKEPDIVKSVDTFEVK